MTLIFSKMVEGRYKTIFTEHITDEDKTRLIAYAISHPQVKGFYRYEFDGFIYESVTAFLLDYIKDFNL